MIEKLRVPDEDIPGWMQTLREGGFTDAEIDTILSNLNQTYSNEIIKGQVETELIKINNEIREKRGVALSDTERNALRKGIESRFR